MRSKNRLILFWKLGKFVFQEQKNNVKIIQDISIKFSYKYGMSQTFSVDNIKKMKLFYLCFPVFSEGLLSLSWEHYLELLKVDSFDKRNFYFRLCKLGSFSVYELQKFIQDSYYERI